MSSHARIAPRTDSLAEPSIATVDPRELHLMTRAAFLYHGDGLRQQEVAERLQVSQARVSRLLASARELGIIRTTVVPPPGLHTAVAHELSRRYGLEDALVVEPRHVGDGEDRLTPALGAAAAELLQDLLVDATAVGLTSWSRAQRAMVGALLPVPDAATTVVVEALGDIGSPEVQHEADDATRRLAEIVGARPVYLRTPAVSTSASARAFALTENSYAGEALALLDRLDLALVGVGTPEVVPHLDEGRNSFTAGDFAEVVAAGAVAELDLRFIDADGAPVPSALDDRVTGITLEQLRRVDRVVAITGGARKLPALRAALRGGWLDVLVTDVATASQLLMR